MYLQYDYTCIYSMITHVEKDQEELYTFLKEYSHILTNTPVPPPGNVAVVNRSTLFTKQSYKHCKGKREMLCTDIFSFPKIIFFPFPFSKTDFYLSIQQMNRCVQSLNYFQVRLF